MPPTTITPTTPITPSAPTGKKVLCVEDEYFIGALYTRALTRAGYSVDVCVNGDEGLQKIIADTYDIVLLDIMIPGISGIDIVETLSKVTVPLKSKVIIMTNMQQSDAERQALVEHTQGYIIKAEITPKQLVEFLATLCF